MEIIRVVRRRRGLAEFWIPEGLEGRIRQLARWHIHNENNLEYAEMRAARQKQFGGLFAIIGE